MDNQPTYEELARRVRQLEQELAGHRHTLRQLAESEERFKALSNATFSGVGIHDAGLILDCNQSLATMTGYTVDELIGTNGLKLIAPECLDEVLHNIRSGYDQRYEVTGLRKDGSVYPLAIKGKNVPYLGKEVRVIEFLDITDRKQAEAERMRLESRLQQAQKMEAIGTLAGGIAHDFNNILAVILGNAELAQDECEPGSRLDNDLEQILLAANRAQKLVRQILDFSREAAVNRAPLKLQPLIDEALKLLRASLPATITIVRDIDPESSATLANPTQIHQILMNLCTNASHAMEATGGELSVGLRDVELPTEGVAGSENVAPGRYVALTVSDNGIGMSQELTEKIFDPYFTTKGVGKGTGMGLATIHGIVRKSDGAISVVSQPGRGSSFHVYLPVADQPEQPEVIAVPKAPQGTERILFVDDEWQLAATGKKILERLGYSVTEATESQQALAMFTRDPEQFDLVVTDQTMPVMTGAELAAEMLAVRPSMPIILCTGYSTLVDENSARSIGIRAFARKPLDNNAFGLLVRRVLDAS